MFFLGDNVKLHCTPVTAELSNLLIEDFIKISGPYLPFEFIDLMAMNRQTVNHRYKESFQIKDFTVTFYDAGHIPGSCVIAVEAGSKRLLYTGDINGSETELLNSSSRELGEANMVITESTYATADHPARVQVERDFVDYANSVVERGGVSAGPGVLSRKGAGTGDDAPQARVQAPDLHGRDGSQGQRGPHPQPGVPARPRPSSGGRLSTSSASLDGTRGAASSRGLA